MAAQRRQFLSIGSVPDRHEVAADGGEPLPDGSLLEVKRRERRGYADSFSGPSSKTSLALAGPLPLSIELPSVSAHARIALAITTLAW